MTIRKHARVPARGEVVVYQNKVEVRLEQDTVWLTQAQMSELFSTERSVITKHLRNIFESKELYKNRNVQKMHIPRSDKPVSFYNLDVIISVGYRVNSKRGTQFRIWATNALRKHLVDGYSLNEKRLRTANHRFEELKKSIKLLGRVAQIDEVSDQAKGIIQVISDYSRALELLDDFDHERLKVPRGTAKILFRLDYENAKDIIDQMRKQFKSSDLVGQEKDQGFKSSIGAIYQTFARKDLYPTVQQKAAHLLYFVTKNHSFVDGNKRIAAALFIAFLQGNRLLFQDDGSRRIDDHALVALTLMVAASKPREKEVMIKVILNLLA